MQNTEHLKLELAGGVAVITIDRPPVNALSEGVLAEMRELLAALAGRPREAGVLVFTGAGTRAFVAGADIPGLGGLDAAGGRRLNEAFQMTFNLVEDFPAPVICAVNGLAFGGGCELAMACDFRIAARSATFSLPETALGLIPGGGGTWRLPRLVPAGRAKRMILSGERVDAAEALAIGLVDEVVEDADLLPTARRWAERLLERGPLALRQAKLAINRGRGLPREEGLRVEAELSAPCFDSEDFREGFQAFREKRRPDFPGRRA